MGIVNRRNAVIGWAVLKLGKRAARKKAKQAVPAPEGTGSRAAAAAGLAALLGVLTFWKRRRGADDGD